MNIEVFKNGDFGELKVLEQNGEFWFIGKEITEVLGYSNSRKALKDHVEKEDKGVTKCDTLGGKQDICIINESGLYSLILSSKLEKAKKFKHWVTSEVLPSIRKHGSYEIPKNPMEALELMFKVEKENTLKIDKLDKKMINLEENASLTPGEYNAIGNRISERIRIIKSDYCLTNANKRQNAELYKSINHDVKEVTGIYTRSQLRKKDFSKVMELIRDWQPSRALLMKIDGLKSIVRKEEE